MQGNVPWLKAVGQSQPQAEEPEAELMAVPVVALAAEVASRRSLVSRLPREISVSTTSLGDFVLGKDGAPCRILEVLKHDASSRVLDTWDGELRHVTAHRLQIWRVDVAGKAFALNLVEHARPIYDLAIEGKDLIHILSDSPTA